MKDQIDGADGVCVGGEALAIAGCLKVHHGSSGGEDAPIYCVGEGLLQREAVTGARRRKRGYLLAVSHGGQCENAKKDRYGRARIQGQEELLID
jgi:hypothetical protein